MQLHYCIATKKDQLNRFFNAKPVYDYIIRYNATTNMFLPAIMDKNPNELVELKWDLPWPNVRSSLLSYYIPLDKILTHWKQPRNIRFILLKAIRSNRCVVLANCYVVWKLNQPFCVYVQDQRLFAFCAIWNESSTHTGFALLTQPANELLAQLDQREMPLILPEWQVNYWLNIKTSSAKITQLLKTRYPSAKMNAYPISPLINDLSINSPQLFHPIGDKLNPDIDYGTKERLVRQGWGRSKIE
jgi:putative SOS response-associated peptidase YedK